MIKQSFLLMLVSLITVNAFAITAGIAGRSKGDVIAVKTDNQIASWCDFSKQIVMSQFNTLCVFNGNNVSVNSDMLSKSN